VIEVEPFGPEHVEEFRALFEASSSSCFCRYWHFTGTKNEWLDRCAHRPDENFDEQAEAVRARPPHASARGLVARDSSAGIIGWMKVAPREALPKLTSLPVYRALPAQEGTWAIGCFLIHPAHRRRGVAKALVAAAEVEVARWGGRIIEAHPRRSSAPLYDEEAWQGPETLFIEAGFAPVHDVPPYPVYRKVLTPR
jgi:GNAT superfamily N-acetyltransferase